MHEQVMISSRSGTLDERPGRRPRRPWAVLLVVVAFLVTFGSMETRAQEASPERLDWVRHCVETLDSEEGELASSASAALGELGVEGLPLVVTQSVHVKTQEGLERLSEVVRALPRRDAVRMLEAAADDYPSAHSAFWRELALELSDESRADAADFDPELVAEVERILGTIEDESTFRSIDPRIDRLAVLGDDVVPILVREFTQTPGHRAFVRREIVRGALKVLAKREHASLFARLVSAGDLDLTVVLAACDAPRVADRTFAEVLDRGRMSYDFATALGEVELGRRTRKALVRYFQDSADASHYGVANAAEVLLATDHPDGESALLGRLERPLEVQGRRGIADALARRGHVEGLDHLIDCLVADEHMDYVVESAGEALDRLTGQRFYADARQSGAGAAEAARRYETWLDEHRDDLEFDDVATMWVAD